MRTEKLRDFTKWSLIIALIFGAGVVAQAQQADDQSEGRIIQIGPDDDVQPPPLPRAEFGDQQQQPALPQAEAQPDVPRYWIGLLGGPVTPELHAQLDIPAGQGLLVREVVPDGPAASGGLQTHDILLRANKQPLSEMNRLIDLVRQVGDENGQIEFDVVRRGQHVSVTVTPTERPDVAVGRAAPNTGWGTRQPQLPPGLNQWFGRQLAPGQDHLQFRFFGPGMVLGDRQFNFSQMPNGVSVSIQKENDQPAHIVVRRGEESWELDADKPEDLEALPEDLRPFVGQMAFGGPQFVPEDDFGVLQLPHIAPILPHGGIDNQQLQKRLDEMEQRMQELQERLLPRQETEPQDR